MTKMPFHESNTLQDTKKINVLMIEGNDHDAYLIYKHLESEGWDLKYRRAESERELSYALESEEFDIILSEHSLPGFDSFTALKIIKYLEVDVPFILVTGSIGGEQAAASVMKAGANDYIPKGRIGTLSPAILRCLMDFETRRSKQAAEEALIQRNKDLEDSLRKVTQIQEQLVRFGRLKGLGEMAAGVAHDFNNALTKIMGVADIALSENVDTRLKTHLENIQTSAQDAAQVVKRVRDFHKVGPAMNVGEPVPINDIAIESVNLTKPKWKSEREANGNVITLESDFTAVPMVLGNAPEFREAITNIIFNACDAMPDGGTLRISSAFNSNSVTLSISDTGTGMTDEVKESCLAPFFSTKGEMGSGLGLALVDGLLQKFGGTLRIDSELGKGTTVHMNFSLYHVREDGSERADNREPLGAVPRLKILVIDDEPEICILIQRILLLDGHQVHAFHDSQQGVEFLNTQPFDVIICDRAMPTVGGDEIAKTLVRTQNKCPFIMISGFGDMMQMNGEVPEGVDIVLPKPISRHDLRKALYDLTRKSLVLAA